MEWLNLSFSVYQTHSILKMSHTNDDWLVVLPVRYVGQYHVVCRTAILMDRAEEQKL
jgi:hypothetical protein